MLLASVLTAPVAHAAPPQPGWDAGVRTFDDAYWAAYNRCDLQALNAMNADDLEFYHDLGGAMRGKAQFDAAMAKNICGNPARKVRREAVAGSVQVYPMMANGVVYGAVIEGNHQFYNAAPGTPEVLAERARFSSLLLYRDGSWKLARAFSYAHAPVWSENAFAMKERDIQVRFTLDGAGKGQGLVVRERGAIVAEATVQAR